ncbi:hypothetical protein [Paraburkholderia humisilvae]|uniref:Uncharacterized protein n=1 Tax=Paraburkholderia humisilvae TaxID=627669 RepID=A0A6J5ETU4_9BURK|nr:hypothetical protein [Paraburkholderia humisilvae]CAB3768572.1 hypothetical protein LMG29542_05894 [Paraburkholderia humisilvae]
MKRILGAQRHPVANLALVAIRPAGDNPVDLLLALWPATIRRELI